MHLRACTETRLHTYALNKYAQSKRNFLCEGHFR